MNPQKGKIRGAHFFFWKTVWLPWIMHKDSKNIEYTSYKARPILDVKAACHTCLILLSWQAVWSLWVVWSKSFFFSFLELKNKSFEWLKSLPSKSMMYWAPLENNVDHHISVAVLCFYVWNNFWSDALCMDFKEKSSYCHYLEAFL